MKSPSRRSVSPFGLPAQEESVFCVYAGQLKRKLQLPVPEVKPDPLVHAGHLFFLPEVLQELSLAPSGASPRLGEGCDFLVKIRPTLEGFDLTQDTFEAMLLLFKKKVSVFLVDHHSKDHGEKMGWGPVARDVVLFSEERDTLITRFFAPYTNDKPGLLSSFITQWVSSADADPLLHFLDFMKGANDPSIEHFLLFSHPALMRTANDKGLIKSLFEKARHGLKRCASPTYEINLKKSLGL